MPEKNSAENFLNNLVDTIAENVPDNLAEAFENIPKKKSVSFFEGDRSNSVDTRLNRLFGRQKPVYHLLGGGKSADVLLWRNKKISAGVLMAATVVWILFEWLNYHFLTLVLLALALGMLAQFVWGNASGFLNRSDKRVPRFVIPEELFVRAAQYVGVEVNRGLRFLQDVACGGNLKQFLVVVGSLWAAAIVGSWCNFLTVVYVGFVAAHTLPVLYEKYEDQVDGFVENLFGHCQRHYRKLDTGFLSRIPKGRKKFE